MDRYGSKDRATGKLKLPFPKWGKRSRTMTLVSWKLVTKMRLYPEVGEVGDNDADDLERTGPRHDQPEIDKGDSGSPEGGGEASAGGEKKHHNDGLESNRTIMGAICECADETEALSQQFVEQLDHKGDLVVTRLTAPLPDEQRRAIIGHSIRKEVVRRELSTFEPTTAGGGSWA